MYNNPFIYNSFLGNNVANPMISRGLFSGIRNLNWSGLLSNTQKTLGIINQAIPIAYQVKPIMNNARTMFRIANTINSNDINDNSAIENKSSKTNYVNKPIFYI